MDYRLIFLFFVVIVLLLYRIRTSISFFGFINRQTVLNVLMIGAILGAVGSFIVMMTDQDPLPFIRQAGYQVGLQQLVSFDDAIPANLQGQLNVRDVMRKDTDGDGFKEWLVFYQFDAAPGKSPLRAVIYDNDRGDPPLIYPYSLRAPNNGYLSDGDYQFEFDDITTLQNGPPDNRNLPELVFWGYPDMPFGIPVSARPTDLTIFRYQEQPGNQWEPPTNDPPRYVAMGRFHGVSVELVPSPNAATQQDVVVYRQTDYERSQLAFRYIYRLNNEGTSYMEEATPAVLRPPVVQTIDFYPDVPDDIYSSTLPENIVLGFYIANCRDGKNLPDLCRHADQPWQPQKFLADEALDRFQNGNADYFGLPNLNSIASLSITDLRFGGEPTATSITPQEGQTSRVSVVFITGEGQSQEFEYQLRFNDGQWNIVQQVQSQVSTLGSP